MIKIAEENRPLATYVCGNPGSGKSSLLQRNILFDIKHGRGVCVIDPTSDLTKAIIDHLPVNRLDDVIYFDTSMPIPLDFFSYRDEDEKMELIDDLIAMFSLDNAPVAQPFLMRVLYTLFEANENPNTPASRKTTFLDIHHFCTQESRREEILSYCSLHREEQFAKMPPFDTVNAIVARMTRFVESKTLRTILSGRGNLMNISEIIDQKKILLVSLKDTPTDNFIASLIISKIQLAIFRRRLIDEPKRTPFYLYIDECNTVLRFAENHFEKILQRARKYKLCLTLANPTPDKLPENIRQLLGTIGNLVIFNLDPENSRMFKSKIAPYPIDTLTNLKKFHALLRTGGKTTSVKTLSFLTPRTNGNAEYIRKRTVEFYPCDIQEEPHTSGDGSQTRQTAPYEDQNRDSQQARRVFRPPDQRPRPHYSKPGTKPYRHPKPEP